MLQPAKVPGMLGNRQNRDQHRTAKEGCGEQVGQGRGQGQDCPGIAPLEENSCTENVKPKQWKAGVMAIVQMEDGDWTHGIERQREKPVW